MEIQSGIAAKVFDILANQNISIKTITTSETKISCVIEKSDELLAVEALSKEFRIQGARGQVPCSSNEDSVQVQKTYS